MTDILCEDFTDLAPYFEPALMQEYSIWFWAEGQAGQTQDTPSAFSLLGLPAIVRCACLPASQLCEHRSDTMSWLPFHRLRFTPESPARLRS